MARYEVEYEYHNVPMHDRNTHNCRGLNCCCGPTRDLEEPQLILHWPFDRRPMGDVEAKCSLKKWRVVEIATYQRID